MERHSNLAELAARMDDSVACMLLDGYMARCASLFGNAPYRGSNLCGFADSTARSLHHEIHRCPSCSLPSHEDFVEIVAMMDDDSMTCKFIRAYMAHRSDLFGNDPHKSFGSYPSEDSVRCMVHGCYVNQCCFPRKTSYESTKSSDPPVFQYSSILDSPLWKIDMASKIQGGSVAQCSSALTASSHKRETFDNQKILTETSIALPESASSDMKANTVEQPFLINPPDGFNVPPRRHSGHQSTLALLKEVAAKLSILAELQNESTFD